MVSLFTFLLRKTIISEMHLEGHSFFNFVFEKVLDLF